MDDHHIYSLVRLTKRGPFGLPLALEGQNM